MAKHKVEAYTSKREWEERQEDRNKYEQRGRSVWEAGGMHGNTVWVSIWWLDIEAQIHQFFTTSVFISHH